MSSAQFSASANSFLSVYRLNASTSLEGIFSKQPTVVYESFSVGDRLVNLIESIRTPLQWSAWLIVVKGSVIFPEVDALLSH